MEDIAHSLGEAVGDSHTDICASSAAKALRSRVCFAWGEPACVRRAGEAGFGRGDRLCARGDPAFLAGRDGVPHLALCWRV